MAHIRFNIQYATQWGEVLCLDFTTQDCGVQTLQLTTVDGTDWYGEVEIPSSLERIDYTYHVRNAAGAVERKEEGMGHFFYLRHRSYVLLCDRWEDGADTAVLQRTAFADCIYGQKEGAAEELNLLSDPYLLLLRAEPPAEGWRWGVLGNSPSLGQWERGGVKYLQRTGVYEWGLPLTSEEFRQGVTYKYVLVNQNDPSDIVWEEGPDRRIVPHELLKNETALQVDCSPMVARKPWRGAGVVIPVFSLRSRESFGVGDFGDLRNFIGWAADVGLSAVQLLPVNDTTATGTWRDSYPYNGISVFALHPLYLDLREWRQTKTYALHRRHGAALNSLPSLDYDMVFKEKMAFLRDLYREVGERTEKQPAYQEFCRDNRDWLLPYARFSVLRDVNHTANFRDWSVRDVAGSAVMESSVKFYIFVQYLLHGQMLAAHRYARERGVILKGDIPIGISRDSVPAWIHGSLFHFDGQAGAPPDDFAVRGQNWGFPTYDWEEMGKDNYAWWRARLAHMEQYFDAYRIDHVLGFFRIWEVPYQQLYGVLGRFRPALPMDAAEIRSRGFDADPVRYSHAFITRERLSELELVPGCFGLRGYFEDAKGVWQLKGEFDTQRKIVERVPEGRCREVLLDVAAEVLFIEDPEQPLHYHPRICGQQTRVYAGLSDQNRMAFNSLHNHFFYERHNDFWAAEALKKIPAVIDYNGSMHSMLPCAEDLGMVPASVKGVLEQLHILSLEIQRMPKEYGMRFGDLQHNPYMSVATIATHDMAPLRLWWKENREQTQAFWAEVLHREGTAPEEATSEICEEVVSRHLECPSMLCLLAFQDLLAIDGKLRHPRPEEELINVPANANHYWRYRMHLTIEELLQATSFNEKLRSLVQRSGR